MARGGGGEGGRYFLDFNVRQTHWITLGRKKRGEDVGDEGGEVTRHREKYKGGGGGGETDRQTGEGGGEGGEVARHREKYRGGGGGGDRQTDWRGGEVKGER